MRLFSFVFATLLLVPVAAKADTVQFNVSGSAAGMNGSAIFTGTGNNASGYTITGITGPAQFGSISLLPVNSPLYLNDNLLFPGQASLVDARGIAFSGLFGTADLFSVGTSYFIRGLDASGDAFMTPATLTLTGSSSVTPEPSSMLLTFTGLLAGSVLVFRKRLFTEGAAPQLAL